MPRSVGSPARLILGLLLLGACGRSEVTRPAPRASVSAPATTATVPIAALPGPAASGSSAPPPARAEPVLPSEQACDAPLPTLGQRWRERWSMITHFADAPGPGNFRGVTRTDEGEWAVEVTALQGNTIQRIRVTAKSPVFLYGEEFDALTAPLAAEQTLSLGQHPWPSLSKPAGGATPGLQGDAKARQRMAAALAARFGGPVSHFQFRVDAPKAQRLAWGSALAFPVSATGERSSLAAGQSETERLTLSGELTVRAADGAFVSLQMQGKTVLSEQWRGAAPYPAVPGDVSVRLERPCFAVALR